MNYNGLAIVLDGLRRHDVNQALGGMAGEEFFQKMLYPVKRRHTSVKLITHEEPIPAGTKAILALGDGTVSTFCSKQNLDIHAARGCPWMFHTPEGPVPAVISYMPQDAMDRRNMERDDDDEDHGAETKDTQPTKRSNWKFWLDKDTQKIKRLLNGNWIKNTHEFNYSPRPSLSALCNTLATLENQTIFVDIETIPGVNMMTCMSLQINQGETFVVPFVDYKYEYAYDRELLALFLGKLSIAFSRNLIVAHNASFDFFILAWKYKVTVPQNCWDTMLCQHRMYPDKEKSLAHCGSLWTDNQFHKDEGGGFEPKNHKQQESLWKYNALDVWLTSQIYYQQLEAVEARHKGSVAQANAMVRPCLTITLGGLKLDNEGITRDHTERTERHFAYHRILKTLCQGELNPNSPQQVARYYRDHLNLKLPTKGKKESTDESALLTLYNRTRAPSVKVILAMRGNRKLQSSTCFNTWGPGERLTTSFNIAGPDTFRLASRKLLSFKKAEHGFGTNIQNWNKATRKFVVADPGKLLVQIDQSGAEAMMVAWLGRPGDFRRLFKSGIKSHVYVAMHLFAAHWATVLGLPNLDEYTNCLVPELAAKPHWKDLDTAIKADALKYATAKMVCHASNYAMGAKTFQKQALVKSNNQLVLTLDQCKRYLTLYHMLFPEISNSYHLNTVEQLKKDMTLTNLFGFPRTFYDPWGDSLFKKGYAFVPQSTSGCLTHNVMIEGQARIERGELPGVDILQNGHDSLLIQAPEDSAHDVAKVFAKMFCVTFMGRDEEFTMKAEYGIGKNWSPGGKKNPDGLLEHVYRG